MQLQFHWYGFIVGFAIIIGSWLIEKKLAREEVLARNFSAGLLFVFVGAIIGARLWHVGTDFELYTHNFGAIFAIWQGGLSIFGGVLGGMLGLLFAVYFGVRELRLKPPKEKKQLILFILDSAVFGVPVGQAIGRVANYVNQELYGLPSSGFFSIYIDEQHRVPGYEHFSRYHPLFLYELLATGSFAVVLYSIHYFKPQFLPKVGTGMLFVLYLWYYSLIRFFLDFLRIDTAVLIGGVLGINQVILLGSILACSFVLLLRIIKWYE